VTRAEEVGHDGRKRGPRWRQEEAVRLGFGEGRRQRHQGGRGGSADARVRICF
jgi:hypothetical protein